MRSSFIGLEVSKRSIQISQKSLDITSNNLSNAKTAGYTRQVVDLSSKYLKSYNNWQTSQARLSLTGQGVFANGVSQARDPYLDKRYRDVSCYVAEYDTKASILTELETTIDNVDNTGLANTLQTLDKALSNYAEEPTNKELASIVRNYSYNMTKMLQSYSNDLYQLRDTNIYEAETSVDYVNELIDKIKYYNKQIVQEYSVSAADSIYNGESVIGTYGPNELIDARNLLVDELSYYADITVTDNSNGSIKINMSGTDIVDDQKVNYLIMKDYENYDAMVVEFSNGDDFNPASGDLRAYMDLLNGNGPYLNSSQSSEYGIPYYISSIDAFAQSFADLMNTTNGFDDANPNRAMFGSINDVYDDEGNCIERAAITASTICISQGWMDDATMIGQHYDESKKSWVLDLDGTTPNNLHLAMNEDIIVGRAGDYDGSIYKFVEFLQNRLGQTISYYEEQYDVVAGTANELLNNRDSISGVSETEEGINMLNYQKWFNASSRMMTTLDDCLDRVINNMGRCGL